MAQNDQLVETKVVKIGCESIKGICLNRIPLNVTIGIVE